MKKGYIQSRRKGIFYIQQKGGRRKGNGIGHVA
jgi:hypothetical protein